MHGRIVTGQDDNDDFTFAPMEQTCNLAVLSPSKQIPMTGGVAANATSVAANAAAATPGTAAYNNGGVLSTPGAPLGNATLSIVSGLPAQAGVPNPLAGRPYLLLRWSYADSLARGGVTVPAGTSAFKYAGTACGTNSPDCPKLKAAINTSAISAVAGRWEWGWNVSGSSAGHVLPDDLRGTYGGQPYVWGQAVQVHAGANSLALDLRSATSLK